MSDQQIRIFTLRGVARLYEDQMGLSLITIANCPDDLAYEIRRYTDWDWDAASTIAYLESGFNWDALNDSTKGGDVPCGTPLGEIDGVRITAEKSLGYFQINECNYPDWVPGQLWNVKQNVGTAHDLWSRRGWEPWLLSARTAGLL